MNFLEETLSFLHECGKSVDDIVWIGDSKFFISIEDFKFAANFEYNEGFGTNYISTDLHIGGNGWIMSRWEYDGSEGWQLSYTEKPEGLERITSNFKNLLVEEIQREECYHPVPEKQ